MKRASVQVTVLEQDSKKHAESATALGQQLEAARQLIHANESKVSLGPSNDEPGVRVGWC